MKIAYLVQQFLPEVGAGPARVGEMMLRWQAAGAEVTVITGMPNRPQGRIHPGYRGKLFVEEDLNGVRVLRSWLYTSPQHGFARTIANNASFMVTGALHALARAGRPDVMIASSPPFFVHLAGETVSRLQRIPLLLELRDLWPDYLVGMGVVREGPAARALFRLERYLLGRAARVVVVTDSFRERVIQKGVPPERVEVIPNGVDTALYYPAAEPPLPQLERRGEEFIVGYLGNFGAGQGLETVLEAAALLAREEPDMRFVLVGGGTQEAQVAKRAEELRLENLSIHPPIPREQTRAFYNACDLCLVPLAPFPVLQETIPSKIFEVMACERPVLASVAGEAARIVESSASGRVTAPGDPAALAQGLQRLKRMAPEERRALGSRGREFVARHFSRAVLADRYLEVLSLAAADAREPWLPRAAPEQPAPEYLPRT